MPPFLRFKGRVAAVTVEVRAVAKSSKKALVKRFCEKNFTEFLLDLKKWSAFFYLPPPNNHFSSPFAVLMDFTSMTRIWEQTLFNS